MLSVCVSYQAGCHMLNLPANTHKQEHLCFKGKGCSREIGDRRCVSCQNEAVLLEVIILLQLAKEPLASFLWSCLWVSPIFMKRGSRKNPWHKTLLSPPHSSCKVLYTQPTSHTLVTFTCAHAAVHTFDNSSITPAVCWQGLWRLRGKLIRGNKQSNSIRGKLQMSRIQFVDISWRYVGTNRGSGDTYYIGGEFTIALAAGLWITLRSERWTVMPGLKAPSKCSRTLCLFWDQVVCCAASCG